MQAPLYPSLYQINTRVVLGEVGRSLGRAARLDDLPDAFLDEVARLGFDWVWMLGVWQTGPAGRAVSRSRPDWREGYRHALPDLMEEDISGSPFAIRAYTVHEDFGGDEALARLRERLRSRGLRLLLDFVPNHVAPDHPWTESHPEFFIAGSEDDLAREPQNYVRVETARGPVILAHGRDPYFPGWPDTLQLNYRHPALREAMAGELRSIARRCDGVRCDMAMLVLPDVFLRTWGDRARPQAAPPADGPFWPDAIASVKEVVPDFVFVAEVYWDLEGTLQEQGFDYTYDKRLYDRLRGGGARAVREHLWAAPEFQRKSVRFLENHDEPRAALAFFPEQHRAAAVVAFLVAGMRFIHEGQLVGRRTHASMHLARRPDEPVDEDLREFYLRLLACVGRPEVRDGRWRLAECRTAWNGNNSWDNFLVFTWEQSTGGRLLVVVNYSPSQAQCYASVPLTGLEGQDWLLRDLLGPNRYDRGGDGLAGPGLYLDLPPWGYHAFEVIPLRR